MTLPLHVVISILIEWCFNYFMYISTVNKNDILAALNKDNLTNYYVLPLLRLNKHRFPSEENFVDSYLDESRRTILVEVRNLAIIVTRMMGHPDYLASLTNDAGRCFIQFKIPEKWYPDVGIFLDGKYSKFSEEAKDAIRIHSRLPLQVRPEKDATPRTDTRLMAIDRNPQLIEFWQRELGVELDESDELMLMPGKGCFISMEGMRPATFQPPTSQTRNSEWI
ncbi:MAG: hypothetical protein EOO01_12295 [Chitinophagaceae bacterium]|nr:MAG: hypothetical protein EOO01_12295 [Chitinophagaceae bacterium]